jgi:hypothetical protein
MVTALKLQSNIFTKKMWWKVKKKVLKPSANTVAPSTSSGLPGFNRLLGRYFRPIYRYAADDSYEDPKNTDTDVKSGQIIKKSQISSSIQDFDGKIACPFSPEHLFKDQKRLKTHIEKFHQEQINDVSNNGFAPTNSISEKLMAYKQKIHTTG